MPVHWPKPSRDYVIHFQLVGEHRIDRLGPQWDEPPLRMLHLEADILVSSAQYEVQVCPPDDRESEIRTALETALSAELEEPLRWIGRLRAFTFVLAPGVLDDCDADSEGAAIVSGRLCRDDATGALARHVSRMLSRGEAKASHVLNVWDAELKPVYLEALPLALHRLHMRFGGLVTFSGDNGMGSYLETRCGFQRVREPIEEIEDFWRRNTVEAVAHGECKEEDAAERIRLAVEQTITRQELDGVWLLVV